MEADQKARVFISYSWDSEDHKHWVAALAESLVADGFTCIVDRWKLVPGDSMTMFMESQITECDFVLCILTPSYKTKSDRRTGGVGYEGGIITAELLIGSNHRKFIPILRSGEADQSIPVWAIGKLYVDMRQGTDVRAAYHVLVSALRKEPYAAEPGPSLAPSWRLNDPYWLSAARLQIFVEKLDLNDEAYDHQLVIDGKRSFFVSEGKSYTVRLSPGSHEICLSYYYYYAHYDSYPEAKQCTTLILSPGLNTIRYNHGDRGSPHSDLRSGFSPM